MPEVSNTCSLHDVGDFRFLSPFGKVPCIVAIELK